MKDPDERLHAQSQFTALLLSRRTGSAPARRGHDAVVHAAERSTSGWTISTPVHALILLAVLGVGAIGSTFVRHGRIDRLEAANASLGAEVESLAATAGGETRRADAAEEMVAELNAKAARHREIDSAVIDDVEHAMNNNERLEALVSIAYIGEIIRDGRLTDAEQITRVGDYVRRIVHEDRDGE